MMMMPRKMNAIFLLVIAILLITMGTSGADRRFLSDYLQVHYDFGTGLLSDEANQVLQTHDGYIWVASYAGLLRYDSQQFQLMKDENGIPVSRVRSLFEDSEQRLWIGTNNTGLLLYEKGKIHKVQQETAAIVRATVEGEDGCIYVASSDGVRYFCRDGQSECVQDSRLVNCLVQSLSFSKSTGKVWGVTFRGDVFSLAHGKVVDFYSASSFQGLTCNSVFCDSQGRIFLGTLSNIVLMKENELFQPLLLTARKSTASIYEDHQGLIWVCTENGLGYFNEQLRYIPIDGSLLSSSIENIYQDYENNYWITSSQQGLLHLIRSKFRNLAFEGSLPMNVYNATASYHGLCYLGNNEGLYILDAQGQKEENELTKLFHGVRIRDICMDSQKNLWIAGYGTPGLVCWKDGAWKNWTKSNGMPSDKIRKILERKNGDIAVGTGDGIAILRDEQLIKTYRRAQGIDNGVILSLEETTDGTLLAGSDGDGIYAIAQDDTVIHLNELDSGEKLGPVLNLCQDDENQGVWITNGNRIFFMENKEIHPVSADGLDFNNIFDIKRIGKKIWLLGAKGIYILNPQELKSSAVSEVEQIGFSTAMQTMLTANSRNFLQSNGTLYLSCSRGVYSIDTGAIYENSVPPRIGVSDIVIDNISIDGRSYEKGETIELPSTAERISIHFEVLSFANADGDLEYYMEDFDKNPTIIHGRNSYEASYTNLKGGDYSFRIRARNGDGQLAVEDKVLHIHKAYGFWELPLVRGLIVLAVVGLIFLGLRASMRHKIRIAQAKQAEYQKITLEAIQAISRTIDAKDAYTNGHSYRVAQYTRLIAKELGWTERQIEEIYYVALLHDIGKIGIPDHILNKPGKLTDEEYAIIKKHSEIGGDILKDITQLPHIREGARYHHERYDGRGYPDGLKGEEIPMEARIIGVADAFDAMYSARVYRKNLSLDAIVQELKRNSGSQFDPKFVNILLDLIRRGVISREK